MRDKTESLVNMIQQKEHYRKILLPSFITKAPLLEDDGKILGPVVHFFRFSLMWDIDNKLLT